MRSVALSIFHHVPEKAEPLACLALVHLFDVLERDRQRMDASLALQQGAEGMFVHIQLPMLVTTTRFSLVVAGPSS